MTDRWSYWEKPGNVKRQALRRSVAQAPRRVRGSDDAGACVADIRRMLETPMEVYLMGDPRSLDELSRGLGLPVETVRDMSYQAVCRRACELYPCPDALGKAVWPLTKPYFAEYDRQLRRPEQGFGDPASLDREADPSTELPKSPARYTFQAYCLSLDKMYGTDDALAEALFDGLFWAGCGSVIPLCKYVVILSKMTFIPRETIVCDLLVRPFLRPYAKRPAPPTETAPE